MRKKVGVSVAAMAALLMNSCGTVCNVATGNLEPYGGLSKDAEFLEKYYHPYSGSGHCAMAGGGGRGAILLLALVTAPLLLPVPELSLTLVGDTVTLPLTVYVSKARHAQDEPPVSPSADPTPALASPPPAAGPSLAVDPDTINRATWHRMAAACFGNLPAMAVTVGAADLLRNQPSEATDAPVTLGTPVKVDDPRVLELPSEETEPALKEPPP